MKELGYVCLRCRVRLLAASNARASTQSAVKQNRNFVHGHDRRDGHSRSFTTKVYNGPPTPSPEKRRDGKVMDGGTKYKGNSGQGGSASLAIFRSIVGGPNAKDTIPPAEVEAAQAATYKLFKDSGELSEMVHEASSPGKSIAPAFAFFEQVIYPQLAAAGTVSTALKDSLQEGLLQRLCEEKSREFDLIKFRKLDSTNLPSLTRISELTLELGILKPATWATLVLALLQHICTCSTSPSDYSTVQDHLNAIARRDALLHDLIGAWKVFDVRGPPTPATNTTPGAAEQHQHSSAHPSGSELQFHVAFYYACPQYSACSYEGMIRPSIAALATFQVLSDPASVSRSVREEAAPLLETLEQVLPLTKKMPSMRVKPPAPGVIQSTLYLYPDLFAYIKSRSGSRVKRSVRRPTPANGSHSQTDAVHRRIRQALGGKDLQGLKKTWAAYWGPSAVPTEAKSKELAKYPEIFDYFIMAFMGLRQPQLGVHIWNHIQSIGVQPTIKTWNSMIMGCTKARNPDGIKTVWERLVKSGIKLDTAIWTARIHGLIVSGDIESGLRALDEMIERWNKRNAPGNAAIAVQPSIEPVNGALTGLLRLDRGAAAKKLLQWAAKQGINPDIFTLNTLLQPLVRNGEHEEVDDIFRMMNELKLSPDAASFTILLDGALKNVGAEKPEKQVEIVHGIMARMKAAGVHVNMQMYAKMLHLLLQQGDAAEEPVKAIIAHLWASGLELTSHIYTILVDYFFTREPPNPAAVTTLITSRGLHENKNVDRVFWERVLKGYAEVGDTDRAQEIYEKVFSPSRTGITCVTFSTLSSYLAALIRENRMQAAAELVTAAGKIQETEDDAGGGMDGQVNPRSWRHRFWHLAEQYGLMDESLRAAFHEADAARRRADEDGLMHLFE
ncbi:hypothetical protein B0H66DRAFT_205501 [Apodospora peruviana]|uniref:Pentatricopeptide repeat protein n=1 Tax=Apodospora peruviana TaxID=516989 RepID=A0AAE0ICB5_9PEZI|nr:hypothetical protein B0H66DRAFT_205501 [Apodospora peruviana]